MVEFASFKSLEMAARVEPTEEELARGERLVEALRGLDVLRSDLGMEHFEPLVLKPHGFLRIEPSTRVKRVLQWDPWSPGHLPFRRGQTQLPFLVQELTYVRGNSGTDDYDVPVVAYGPRVLERGESYGSRYGYYYLDLAQHSLAILRVEQAQDN